MLQPQAYRDINFLLQFPFQIPWKDTQTGPDWDNSDLINQGRVSVGLVGDHLCWLRQLLVKGVSQVDTPHAV